MKAKEKILKVKKYSPPLEHREKHIRLDFNENTRGCSPAVLRRIQKIKKDDLSVYPSYSSFINTLAKKNKVKPSQIILTNGSSEAIRALFQTFINDGDELVLPTPTFSLFPLFAQIAGARITAISYEKNLDFPFKKVMHSIQPSTKIVVLVNPNNPTGTTIENKNIERIAKKAKNALILIDEAYYPYYNHTALSLLKKYPNIAILRTFSKVYGLAGIRLGYLIAHEEITREVQKVLSPYCVSSLAVLTASAALEEDTFVKETVQANRKNKEFLVKELSKMGVKTYPSEANFVLAVFDNPQRVLKELEKRKILIRDVTVQLPTCLRITIGTRKELDCLLDVLGQIHKKR